MENENSNEELLPQRQEYQREISIEVLKGIKKFEELKNQMINENIVSEKAAVDFDAKLCNISESGSEIEDGLIEDVQASCETTNVHPKELQRELSIEMLKGNVISRQVHI